MPVHPHFGDLSVLGLAEHRAAGVHPVAAAAPPVRAAELTREPRPRDVDLSRLEGDVGLVDGNVLPIVANRLGPDAPIAERGRKERGVGGEHGHDGIDIAALPPLAKRLQQRAIGLVHGAQYTAIRNRRTGAVRAAAGGARPRGDRGQRSDDHRPGDRHELLHDERRVRDRAQGVRAGVREGGRAAGRLVERRHDLRRGQLQARRPAEREARAVHRGQSEGDGDASHGERSPHDRDQDGLGRDLMRRTLGAAVLSAALVACGSPAPSGFTLLFLRRSPAAFAGGLCWAPDPEQSRLIAFDRRLQVAKRVTSPRLAMPMAVAALGDARLLVTERTGEGVVFDTAGRPVREWDSPDVASLYAAGGGRGGGQRIVAVRSPYYVPQLGAAEPDTAPLVRVLDTLGRPVEGLATIRVPQAPFLTYLVNAGAVAAGPDGSVYYAPPHRR